MRLAETSKRRKLPIAIINAFRLIPVFARLREVVVSGCLGTIEAIQISLIFASHEIIVSISQSENIFLNPKSRFPSIINLIFTPARMTATEIDKYGMSNALHLAILR